MAEHEPLATFHYEPGQLDQVLEFLKRTRNELRTLRRVHRRDPRNADVLAYIGFAYEDLGKPRRAVRAYERALALVPDHVIAAARRKLARKGCDLLVANDISQPESGFDVDTNTVSFVWPSGEVESLPPLSKQDVARHILDRIRALRESRG